MVFSLVFEVICVTLLKWVHFCNFHLQESGTPALQGLSFTVRPGELLAVVGPVGAGKSSLLSALLGEMPLIQGNVNIHGRIAYVSQQPWVFPGTMRSNILFGKKYEEDRYKEVIKACDLEKVNNDF
uniref:ABC transporter domain-containing protein n=1 Tax=Capra hircus TaxID=9925 RepID=A0A452FNH8_CAPHI